MTRNVGSGPFVRQVKLRNEGRVQLGANSRPIDTRNARKRPRWLKSRDSRIELRWVDLTRAEAQLRCHILAKRVVKSKQFQK
jgi:hypothetical protein